MKLNSTNNLNQSILSAPHTASHVSTLQKQQIQSSESLLFSGTAKKTSEEKAYTRKERMDAAWNALKKDCKNPMHAFITMTGLIGLVAVPSAIIASLFFPPAVPILYPVAAGSSVWSGVALWRGFGVAKEAYKKPTVLLSLP